VAAIAIFVGYGVANLTLKVTKVLLVLEISLGIGPDVLMAFFAFHYIWILISGGYRLV